MSKPAHLRMTFEGHVGSSASSVIERWSFSLNAPDNVALSAAAEGVLDAAANTAHDAFEIHLLNEQYGEDIWLDKVTVAAIDGEGLYRVRGDGSYIKGEHVESVNGFGAATGMPSQIACCVSLVTTRSGATGKGRFFLPWPLMTCAPADRLVPEAQVDSLLADVAAFLGILNDINGFNIAVVSSKGYTSDVTAVRIGRAPDTLRSRREDLSEGYRSAAVPQ